MKIGDTLRFDLPDFTIKYVTLRNEHMLKAAERGLYARAADIRYILRCQGFLEASVACHRKSEVLIHPAVLRLLNEKFIMKRRK